MILKFDKEKLNSILSDYSRVTGVSIALVDSDFEFMASSDGKGCKFCRILQEADNAYRCRNSDLELLRKCKLSGKAETHECHAGLFDVAVPLMANGEFIAYIILGRIGRNSDFGSILPKISWYKGDIDILETEFSKLAYYDEEGINSIANIAVAVAAYILGDGVVRPQYNFIAEKAAQYISDNLQKNITVNLLCHNLGVSKNLLYEAFRTAFGCTVKEYVSEKRISRAMKLLFETEIPVCEIADSVGIYNHAYFSRIITQRVGCSPLKYRRNANNPKV